MSAKLADFEGFYDMHIIMLIQQPPETEASCGIHINGGHSSTFENALTETHQHRRHPQHCGASSVIYVNNNSFY